MFKKTQKPAEAAPSEEVNVLQYQTKYPKNPLISDIIGLSPRWLSVRRDLVLKLHCFKPQFIMQMILLLEVKTLNSEQLSIIFQHDNMPPELVSVRRLKQFGSR